MGVRDGASGDAEDAMGARDGVWVAKESLSRTSKSGFPRREKRRSPNEAAKASGESERLTAGDLRLTSAARFSPRFIAVKAVA
jgi:hypothetical protein